MQTLDVKEVRSKLNLTQEQLANALHTTVRTIQNWEAGSKIPANKINALNSLMRQSTETVLQDAINFESASKLKIRASKKNAKGLKSQKLYSPSNEVKDDVPDKYISYLVPMSVVGGSLMGFDEEGVRREDCEKVVTPIPNIDWVVPVCGDSMEPEYPNGSRVYVREINPRDFIPWGNVFVLDTTNGLIIKVVEKSDNEGCVRCVSLNPSGRYAPFDVPMHTIRAMFRVMLCVAVK